VPPGGIGPAGRDWEQTDRLLPDVDVDDETLTALRIPDDPREVDDGRQPVV